MSETVAFFGHKNRLKAATLPTNARPSGLFGLPTLRDARGTAQRQEECRMGLRLRTAKRRQLVQGVLDLIAATAVIWIVSLLASAHHGKTFVLLTITVAAITACNLAFLRHLRRAYASPRRGVWRRV
jgi:hypothetical protein